MLSHSLRLLLMVESSLRGNRDLEGHAGDLTHFLAPTPLFYLPTQCALVIFQTT